MTKAIKNDIIHEIVEANKSWFEPGKREFFGDLAYYGFELNEGGKYLIQETFGFSDMFGKPKQIHYRVHEVGDDFVIGKLFKDEIFDTLLQAKEWIQNREQS